MAARHKPHPTYSHRDRLQQADQAQLPTGLLLPQEEEEEEGPGRGGPNRGGLALVSDAHPGAGADHLQGGIFQQHMISGSLEKTQFCDVLNLVVFKRNLSEQQVSING